MGRLSEALPCIACGARLENIAPEDGNQPCDGVAFTSYGHYGTCVFDPMDGSFLEINICDDCLRNAIAKRSVLQGWKVPAAPKYMMRQDVLDMEQVGRQALQETDDGRR